MRIAEENVCQHRADAARRKAIPGAQQPAGQQHEAVAQVHIALHRRGDLHDHRRHADKRRKQCGKDKLSDLFIVHDWVLLCFGCWPYYIPSWYYSYSQNKTNYADQICPKLEKSGAARAAPHIGKDLVLLGLLGFGKLLGFLRSGRFLFRVLLDGHLDDGLLRLLGSGSLSLGGLFF